MTVSTTKFQTFYSNQTTMASGLSRARINQVSKPNSIYTIPSSLANDLPTMEDIKEIIDKIDDEKWYTSTQRLEQELGIRLRINHPSEIKSLITRFNIQLSFEPRLKNEFISSFRHSKPPRVVINKAFIPTNLQSVSDPCIKALFNTLIACYVFGEVSNILNHNPEPTLAGIAQVLMLQAIAYDALYPKNVDFSPLDWDPTSFELFKALQHVENSFFADDPNKQSLIEIFINNYILHRGVIKASDEDDAAPLKGPTPTIDTYKNNRQAAAFIPLINRLKNDDLTTEIYKAFDTLQSTKSHMNSVRSTKNPTKFLPIRCQTVDDLAFPRSSINATEVYKNIYKQARDTSQEIHSAIYGIKSISALLFFSPAIAMIFKRFEIKQINKSLLSLITLLGGALLSKFSNEHSSTLQSLNTFHVQLNQLLARANLVPDKPVLESSYHDIFRDNQPLVPQIQILKKMAEVSKDIDESVSGYEAFKEGWVFSKVKIAIGRLVKKVLNPSSPDDN